MFTPATRIFIANPVINHDYNIDSGMGGAFSVVYHGKKNNKHLFVNPPLPYSPKISATFHDSELVKNVFILVPRNESFQQTHQLDKIANNIPLDHDIDCKECRKQPIIDLNKMQAIPVGLHFQGDKLYLPNYPIGVYLFNLENTLGRAYKNLEDARYFTSLYKEYDTVVFDRNTGKIIERSKRLLDINE